MAPSPDWLRAKLESVGLRSINNIVDITNFVMLEIGQPLHAFDIDTLHGGIEVRLAHEGEKFLALDGKTYSLGQENLVIADEQRAVAIAGVMGGEETGVTAKTRQILLESAYFLPASVRRTARKLNLPSDSSYRFERGVDPGMVLRASQRATDLIRELAGGEPGREIATAGDVPIEEPTVTLRSARSDQLLGVSVPREASDRILTAFGLSNQATAEDGSTWKIPSYRADLRREVDLIEEIVRAHGINRIPSANRSRFTSVSAADTDHDRESRVRQLLTGQGISEARTSALLPRGRSLFNPAAMELKNPLSEDHVALRPSLLPGLLAVLGRNLRNGASSIRLFEIGRTFSAESGDESRQLALLFCGQLESHPHWRGAGNRRLDLFDAKGVLETLGENENLSFRRSDRTDLALSTEVLSGGKAIGFIGQLSAGDASAAGANSAVIVAEVALSPLLNSSPSAKSFTEIEKFPSVTRDIAMIVSESLTHERIIETILDEPLLRHVRFFDLFVGPEAEKTLGPKRKSVAYTLTYRDKNRTLTNDEINVVHARIRERLQRELAVELRE